MTASVALSILGVLTVGYVIVLRPGGGSRGAAVAAADVSNSRAVAVLEQQRQQMIVMDAASHTLSVVGAPKVAAKPTPTPSHAAPRGAAAPATHLPPPNPGTAQSIAYTMMSSFGWNPQTYFSCLNDIWTRESGWRYNAENASGAYGIPQALPGSKMAAAGADWRTNPATQIKWGLGYIQGKYGNPCSAWAFWQSHSYY